MTQNNFPPGWDEARVRGVLAHYESQTEDEAVAEDEAAGEGATDTVMSTVVCRTTASVSRRAFMGAFERCAAT